MKTTSKKTILLFLFGLLIVSCTPATSPSNSPPSTLSCSTANTSFQQLYANVLTIFGYSNAVSYDTEVHEYKFQMNSNISICSIGYQSQPAIASVPYLMQILDASNTIIYSGNLVFSSITTSYVPITPVPIVAGQVYTMRRTMLLSTAGNFGNIIGRLVNQPGALSTFPQTFGPMTIVSANFYQQVASGSPLPNRGIPFIDFGY